jgi:phosphoribosylanthranilate isomerase
VAPVGLLQFHGSESPAFCRQFGLPYIKAVRVRPGTDLLQYARDYHDAKALLLDAFVEGTHGGTGQSFDWSLIPRTLPLPVVLSGGLDAGNVAGAIQQVRPWAVDVSSGVEAAPGVKDAAKIAAFMSGVRNADV